MEKINLSVPFPCSENWDNMSKVHQGRHCAVCQTTVYDFASMSDEEITNFFLNYKGGKLCGRIIEQQPTQCLPRRIARRSFSLRAIFVGLSLMASFTTTTIKAGGIILPKTFETPNMSKIESRFADVLIQEYQFKGKITAQNGDFAKAYVEIFVDNQKIAEGFTNPNGEFSISGYASAKNANFYIYVSYRKRKLYEACHKLTPLLAPLDIHFTDFMIKK